MGIDKKIKESISIVMLISKIESLIKEIEEFKKELKEVKEMIGALKNAPMIIEREVPNRRILDKEISPEPWGVKWTATDRVLNIK